MEDFWTRLARSRFSITLLSVYLYAVLCVLVVGLYLVLRATFLWAAGWAVPDLDPLEIMAAIAAGLTLAWMYVHTVRNHATRILLLGLRVRGLGDRHEGYVALKQILADLKPRFAVPRLEVTMAPLPAINVLAFRTFDDRSHLVITEGAVLRLSPRHLYGLVAHAMARLVLPEARSWSAFTILFGALQQLQLRYRYGLQEREKIPFSKLRVLGGFFALLGRPSIFFLDPEVAQRADHEAALHTRDPVGLAEALYIARHQWRGGVSWSPYISYGAALDARPASRVGTEILSATALFSPLPRRMRFLMSMVEKTVSLEFDMELARRKVQRRSRTSEESGESEDGYLVYCDGEVQGPFSEERLLEEPWFNAQTLVRSMLNQHETKMAFHIEELYELLSAREQASFRKLIPTETLDFGVHSMELCPESRGIWVGSSVLEDVGIEINPRFTAILFQSVIKQLERELRVWNREKWSMEDRVFPPPKVEDPNQEQYKFWRVHENTCVVGNYSVHGERFWIDPEDFSYLLSDFPRVTELPPLAEAEDSPTDLAEIYGLPRLAPTVAIYSNSTTKKPPSRKVSKKKKAEPPAVVNKPAEQSQPIADDTETTRPGMTGADLIDTSIPVSDSQAPKNEPDRESIAASSDEESTDTGIRKRGGLIRAAYVPADPQEIRRQRIRERRRAIRSTKGESRPLRSKDQKPDSKS